MSSSNCQKH